MVEDPEAERLRMAVDVAGLGLWRFDVGARTIEWDARTKALYGLPPDAETSVETFQTGLHPDDREWVVALLDEALKDRTRERFELEHRTVGPDGAVRWVLGHGRVVRDEIGRAVALFGTSRDVTERRRAEEALRDSEARVRTLSDNLPSAMIYQVAVPKDGLDRRFLYVSRRCEELNGVPAEAVLADAGALYGLIAPEERERVGAIEARCTVELTPFDLECRFELPDRGSRWFRLISAPRRMDDGGTIWDGLQIDVTERRLAEQRRRLLTDELNHRVKNTLAIVQALSVQTFREDTASADARARFEGRLTALSTAHDLLTEENWEGASLKQVVQAALSGPFAPDGPDRLVIEGPDHRLTPKTAVNLAMALHELGANASKHGAWSGREGRVRIAWTLAPAAEGRRLDLRWEESGGPEVRPPSRRGFGSRLVGQGLAAELGGEVALDYALGGLVCTIRAVLPNEDVLAVEQG